MTYGVFDHACVVKNPDVCGFFGLMQFTSTEHMNLGIFLIRISGTSEESSNEFDVYSWVVDKSYTLSV